VQAKAAAANQIFIRARVSVSIICLEIFVNIEKKDVMNVSFIPY
jgi:hypothetical protein